jgi:hypothetical protein
MCGAASYRRLVHRGPEGAMVYSGLYRCSGCSVTFSDPLAWRDAASGESTAHVEPAPVQISPPSVVSPGRDTNPSGWGITLPRLGQPLGFGYSEEDLKEIRDAAARANKSKTKGRRG